MNQPQSKSRKKTKKENFCPRCKEKFNLDINAAKKILALDVGSGTLDILLYDKRKNLENCTKMVLPSPSIVFAKQVQKATRNRKHIFIDGDVIGGGAFAFVLRKHIEKGYKVLMTENAAYTVRNDLDQVRNLGIEIVGKEPVNFDGIKLIIKEIDLGELKNFFEKIGEDLSDLRVVAIAVQDHGVSPKGISDRVFRFEKIKDLLKKNQRLESFAFKENEIPRYFVRMRSAVKAVKRDLPNAKVIVMDTAPAAFLGCLKDPRANYIGNLMAVNVGNGHTTAALISDGKIDGIFEHHTELLSPNKLEEFLVRFANGSLTNKEVLDDGGHGVYVLNSLGFGSLKAILVTGPKRSIFNKTHLKFHFASPGGDVMMAGTVGLIEAARRRLEIRW